MEAYQFSFDRVEKNYDISEGDGQWAQVDLNPAMSYYQLRDMMRVLVQRFPPAATVVLNFPVWQNTSKTFFPAANAATARRLSRWSKK